MEQKSEKQIVEEYLKTFALEECLDEIINDVIERRPENPYAAIAQAMGTKTMPEIIDVFLTSFISANGQSGVEARVVTNLDTFSGLTGAPSSSFPPTEETLRDYSTMAVHVKDLLKSQDPRNLDKVDPMLEMLSEVGVSSHVIMAVSMACCRAGARHKALPLYKYLAESFGTQAKMIIPTPVVTVLTRAATNSSEALISQEITVTPTTVSSVDNSLESCIAATNAIRHKLDVGGGTIPMISSDCGCPRVVTTTLEEAIAFVTETVTEAAIDGQLKLGLDFKAVRFALRDESEGGGNKLQGYQMDGPANPVVSGNEVSDIVIRCWKDGELISIEDPLDGQDTSIRQFRNKMDSVIADIEHQMSDTLSYNFKGVGGEEGCKLQVICDGSCREPADIAELDVDKVYNAVKINLGKCATVTKAAELCKAAQAAGWIIVCGADERTSETCDSFIADFAVAMGAGQLAAGGVCCAEHAAKYNRLLEIARSDDTIGSAGKTFRR